MCRRHASQHGLVAPAPMRSVHSVHDGAVDVHRIHGTACDESLGDQRRVTVIAGQSGRAGQQGHGPDRDPGVSAHAGGWTTLPRPSGRFIASIPAAHGVRLGKDVLTPAILRALVNEVAAKLGRAGAVEKIYSSFLNCNLLSILDAKLLI